MRKLRSDRGNVLLETAIALPILLLVAVGVFEFGRAYQTWEVLTNAAREGARVAVTPSSTTSTVDATVRQYMQNGQLSGYSTATVTVNKAATLVVSGTSLSASRVTVNYPFAFVVLQPVARLVDINSQVPGTVTMQATALMRNETQ